MASPKPTLAADAPTRGIICMIVGTILLTSGDAVTKWLLTSLHPGDIMAWRGLLSLPIVMLILRSEGARVRSLKPRLPFMTGLRACLALATSVMVIISFQVLPLADALALIFVSPLMITALSALVLKEHVGWRRWAATLTGFGGALLIVGPSFQAIGVWVLAPLAAAFFAALRDIATRSIGKQETGPAILFWTMLIATVAGFASLPVLGATPLNGEAWMLLAAAAVMSALSHRLTIAAFKLASGAVVAPLKYLALLWAAGIGYIVWGELPEQRTILGAIIVAAAGLYIWRREIVLARKAKQ